MPRTKQVKKKSSISKRNHGTTFLGSNINNTTFGPSENPDSCDLLTRSYELPEDFKKAFQTYSAKKIEAREIAYQTACNKVKTMISFIINSFPQSTRNLKLTEKASESDFSNEQNRDSDQNTDPNTMSIAPKTRASRSRKPVESFDFKRPMTPTGTKRTSSNAGKRSSSRKRSASAPKPEVFKTPIMSTRKFPAGSVITPKIADTPMSVIRRPLHGEMAVSMSGSPLMLGAASREDIPTVNVPLQDGRVFSIIPEKGDPPLDLPNFDETTKQYLKTLREHLEILAPKTP